MAAELELVRRTVFTTTTTDNIETRVVTETKIVDEYEKPLQKENENG